MAKDLKQILIFDASPRRLFEAFTNSAIHRRFTGTPAKVSAKPGASFTAYGGYIRGVNLDVRKDARLVQAWRGGDWPPGEFSLVHISFEKIGRGRTRVTFVQRAIPNANFASIRKGWETFYWKPLRRYLAAKVRPR